MICIYRFAAWYPCHLCAPPPALHKHSWQEFAPDDYDADGSWAGRSPTHSHPNPTPPKPNSPSASPTVPGRQVVSALWRLSTECESGGLLQRLSSFGHACCLAFPQRGCCGNPLCINLDKFSEGDLATRGCKGCNKVGYRVRVGGGECPTTERFLRKVRTAVLCL